MRALVVIAALALAPTAAHADSEAKAIAERGFAAYDDGDYAAAISYFEQAYEADPTPGLLFNIAQAYRKLGVTGCERALEYYKRYRDALAERDKPVGEGLHARIVEMHECAESGEGGDPTDETTDETTDQPQIELQPKDTPPRPDSSRRLVGWIAIGGGAVAVATAAITGSMALDRESELSSSCDGGVCPPALEGRVNDYNKLRFAAFGSGAIGITALAVGGYLVLSSKSSEPAAKVSVQPVVGIGSVGVRCEF